MINAVRSLAPVFIAADELGSREDAEAVICAARAGVKVICTAHGAARHMEEARGQLKYLLNTGIFEKYIFLGPRTGEVNINIGQEM